MAKSRFSMASSSRLTAGPSPMEHGQGIYERVLADNESSEQSLSGTVAFGDFKREAQVATITVLSQPASSFILPS